MQTHWPHRLVSFSTKNFIHNRCTSGLLLHQSWKIIESFWPFSWWCRHISAHFLVQTYSTHSDEAAHIIEFISTMRQCTENWFQSLPYKPLSILDVHKDFMNTKLWGMFSLCSGMLNIWSKLHLVGTFICYKKCTSFVFLSLVHVVKNEFKRFSFSQVFVQFHKFESIFLLTQTCWAYNLSCIW